MLSFQFFIAGSATSQQCKNKKKLIFILDNEFFLIREVPTEHYVAYASEWVKQSLYILNEIKLSENEREGVKSLLDYLLKFTPNIFLKSFRSQVRKSRVTFCSLMGTLQTSDHKRVCLQIRNSSVGTTNQLNTQTHTNTHMKENLNAESSLSYIDNW